jgi:tripartite-type tricarboxylate transporter receptor subunit TctC
MQRRQAIQHGVMGLAAMAASGASPAWAQQGYPNKPIKLIVPLAAGSAVDNAARIVMQKMALSMGQGIAIENQAGASGLIGADRVAKSTPDGYTLGGFNDSIMTMLPNLQSKMPWDILRDFEPVSLVATVEWGLVVPADSPLKTAGDLIAAARHAPGKVNYGSGGNGSPQHMAMALFASQAGVQLTHVPYKGATQAAVGVAGKEVDAAFQGIATVSSLVKAGKLRLIAVTTPKRLAQFPDVPTVGESGLSGFEFNSWFALMAPANTPKPIVKQLHQEVSKALGDTAVRDQLMGLGLTPRGTSPDELGAALRAQLARYEALIKQAGISVD